jgi:hypothetical protein
MAEYGEGSMLHLTGVWQGRYTYPHHMPPVSFVATLIETATRLSGSTVPRDRCRSHIAVS